MTTTRIDVAAPRPARALAYAAALAPVALAVFTAVSLAMALVGRHPLWRISEINIAEAAATRDAASVVLMIEEGHDPDLPRFVRPGLLGRGAVRATPLEAAIAEDRLEIVDVLLRHGASLSEAQRVEFTCAARRRGDTDIVRYFEARGGPVACPPERSDR